MKKTTLIIGVAGLIFSGYLSAVKLFSNTCAFNESCPYFLGYPACYYGFVLFLIITIITFLRIFKLIENKLGLIISLATSFFGVLFAGYFTFKELPLLLTQGISAYIMGLPTCALGLIFYILISGLLIRDFICYNKTKFN